MTVALSAGSEPLPSPAALRARLQPGPRAARALRAARSSIRRVLAGRDHRLVAVVGPCSIHDPDAALRYASGLAALALRTCDVLLPVMRTYFEKPRTRLGWKGYLFDPACDGSGDVSGGLRGARELLLAIGELGLPCASELVEPVAAPYLEDLLALGVIGARTAESPVHRELASGLGLPVGFKNSTNGDVQVAVDAALVARAPQAYPGLDPSGVPAIVRTGGNLDTFVILRGGQAGPNYARACVADAAARLGLAGGERRIWIDCSHGNSGKDPGRQPDVLRDVLGQLALPGAPIGGVLLESHLLGGRQDPGSALEYGVSITDACLCWEETESLLLDAAASLRRRARGSGREGPAPARSARPPRSAARRRRPSDE